MRKLLMILAVASLFAACNNSSDDSKSGLDSIKPVEDSMPKNDSIPLGDTSKKLQDSVNIDSVR